MPVLAWSIPPGRPPAWWGLHYLTLICPPVLIPIHLAECADCPEWDLVRDLDRSHLALMTVE